MDAFRAASLAIDFAGMVPPNVRARWLALPGTVAIRGRDVPIDYDIESTDGQPRGVARLRLPEKLARTLTEEELPSLDRPIQFTVLRGPRGAVRATTLDGLQEILDRPWSPDEVVADDAATDLTPRDERQVKELAREFRREQGHRRRHSRPGDDRNQRRRGAEGRGTSGGARRRGRRRRGR
jgi:hypothetical protein